MKFLKKCCKCIGKELKLKNFCFEYDRVDLFYRSQCQNDEVSIIYFLYRWLLVSFFLPVYIYCISIQFYNGKFFIYMTNWGFGLCALTQLIAAVHVTQWHFDLCNVRSRVYEAGNKAKTKCSLKVYWLLYGVTLSTALIISTIYWLFLHGKMNKPSEFPITTYMTHGVNSVLMLLDFFLVGFPLRLLHICYSMLFAIVFFVFSIIYHLCGGSDEFGNPYIYSLLDWTNPKLCVLTFVGIFMLYVIYWSLLFSLYKLKQAFTCEAPDSEFDLEPIHVHPCCQCEERSTEDMTASTTTTTTI